MQFFTTEMFSNAWCSWAWQNYSTILTTIPIVAYAVLQAIAILHPGVTTNSIFGLINAWASKKGSPATNMPSPPA